LAKGYRHDIRAEPLVSTRRDLIALIRDAGFLDLFLASRVCHLPGSNDQEGLTAFGT
jgi:hypothetical protein